MPPKTDATVTDLSTLQDINARYMGRWEVINLADPATRTQLIFDFGHVVGMAMRYVSAMNEVSAIVGRTTR